MAPWSRPLLALDVFRFRADDEDEDEELSGDGVAGEASLRMKASECLNDGRFGRMPSTPLPEVGGGSRQRRLAIVGKVVVMLVDEESLLVAFLPLFLLRL